MWSHRYLLILWKWFIAHLEVKYGGFCLDQMQTIQDFKWKKEYTPRTMYTPLGCFVVESRGVFTKNQLVKIFFSKIEKHLLGLARPRIILKHERRATLAQVFSIVKKCNWALCQHDAIDMASWMTDASRPKKANIATSSLADMQLEKTLHCWRCGLTKNDPNCPKKKKAK